MPVIDIPVIKLPALIEGLNCLYAHKRESNVPVYGISHDSRSVKPGHLFVAVKGEEDDGHNYIDEALRKGAVAIIAENKPSSASSPVTWIQVPDSRLALSHLAANLFRHPSRELMLVGVTGTCGKTTITSMLQEIYRTAGYNTGLIGTVYVQCNRQTWRARMTTPDALEVQRLLRLMVDNSVSHAVMEVSSHGLAQKRVEGLNFHGALFTNISPNHLDFHKNLKDYAAAKWRLASLVEKGGFILVNGDDPFFRNMQAPARNIDHLFLGNHPLCDFRIDNVVMGKEGSTFTLTMQNAGLLDKHPSLENNVFRLGISLWGKHNIFNGAAAAAAALLTGIPAEHVRGGLATFPGVERRLQLYRFGEYQVLDDTAMSPGSINAVFNTLEQLAFSGPNLVVVYAIRGRRGVQVNEDNGRVLARWVKKLKIRHFFSTCSINHVDEQNRVLPQERESFSRGTRTSGIAPIHFAALEEALAQALKVATPGAVLLLLGAQGMDAGLKLVQEQLFPKGV
ncbi:MAG: UDP-N-acetylmuramyl-tripeptide synthetase [Bacillota bacterium]